MAEKPDYYIFDVWGRNAQVVAPRDESNAAWIIRIADGVGGQKTIPTLM